MSLLPPSRENPADPVGALSWRDWTTLWRSLQYAWRKGMLPILLLMFGLYALFLGSLNFRLRGSSVFLVPSGLQYVVVLDLAVGGVMGIFGASRLFSRRWNDLLLPISWDHLVRERRRCGFPWLIISTPFMPLLLVAETIPVPVSVPLLLRLFLILCWTYLSGALTAYYLVMGLQIWLGKIPDRIARWIVNGSKAIILAVVYGFMVLFLVSILWDWSGGEMIVQALTRAPVALILAKPADLLDFVGIGVSVLVPALLASYAGSQDIHLRLPSALYLASEMGGSLSQERPLQPGLWTNLRLRFRARYRDMGTGPRAVTGLMLTLGMRSGVALMLAIFAGMAISLAVLIMVSGHGWHLAVFVGGGILSLLIMIMGFLLPTQITLPGTAGTYSTARLLPFSGPQLFRAHGILVWPIQLAVASFLGLYTYVIGGGPIGWLVFGAVLTTELLATWGSQTGIFSGSGKPHGQGLPTFRLQWGVASICLFLLYPIEGYVAFTMVAPSDLILDAYLISILAVNLVLVAALTAFSIRRYGNPPGRGIGTGTPPTGGGQQRA